jgi:hypothetical protein
MRVLRPQRENSYTVTVNRPVSGFYKDEDVKTYGQADKLTSAGNWLPHNVSALYLAHALALRHNDVGYTTHRVPFPWALGGCNMMTTSEHDTLPAFSAHEHSPGCSSLG